MKTVTEFTGLEIKKLLKIQSELMKNAQAKAPENSAKDSSKSIEQAPVIKDETESKTVSSEQTLPEPNKSADQDSTDQNNDPSEHIADKNTAPLPAKNEADDAEKKSSSKETLEENTNKNALKPKQSGWNERAEAIRLELIETLKKEFSWKNEDRYGQAIDASRAVNPKIQERLRKVTAFKKDNEEEKTPKHAFELGDLIFMADYLVIQNEKNHDKKSKNNSNDRKNNKNKGKKKFKHKPFNDDDKKPKKRIKKPVPNPVKSNNKTVTVEKK